MATIWSALLNGAALLPYQLREEGVSYLADWLCQEKISIYFSIPSVFRQLAERLTGKEDFSQLRIFHVATERVTKQDVELFQSHFPSHCIFVTGLASNETGRSRQFFIDKHTVIDESIVPVGYEVEGKKVLLLNEDGQESGYNQTGEIVIKSKYLSPGYWKQPDLTRAVFRPDPSGEDIRLYFTGDLGVMRPDGCLLLMGRKDFQAKIRGYRVEFAEIEATLLSSGLVKEAVVVARDNEQGSKVLVAYTVPSGERPCSSSELRQKIQEKLPEYMIPTYFITLDSLPHTPTGKLDRLALPDPGDERPELDAPFLAPRTLIEEKVSKIWTEVLGLDQVGIDDPFLELGGDSLRAMQVISRVRDRFNVEISMTSILLEAPNVAEMAAIIARHLTPEGDPDSGEHVERV
jgi:acyl-coenzyme A synthetase/AMP-(fatty) acid ligase/acyl carrier protein